VEATQALGCSEAVISFSHSNDASNACDHITYGIRHSLIAKPMRSKNRLYHPSAADHPDRAPSVAAPVVYLTTRPVQAEWTLGRTRIRSAWMVEIGRVVTLAAVAVQVAVLTSHPGPRLTGDRVEMLAVFGALLTLVASYAFFLPGRNWPLRAVRRSFASSAPEAVAVAARIFEDELELGRDRGLLWEREGVLRFEGLATSFAIGRGDLRRFEPAELIIDPHRAAIHADERKVTLEFSHFRSADRMHVREVLTRWSASLESCPSLMLPPRMPKPRELPWLLGRTFRRAPAAVLAIVGSIILNEVVAGTGASAWLRYRIDLLVVAAALHCLVITYRRVRRDDEARIAEFRSGLNLPRVPDRTAEQMSVGVRLNSL
jgi:hypothetical protein